MSTASLLWGVLFGSLGLGFFVYGKRQQAVVPLICGIALMVVPYFIPNALLLVGVGVVLSALPFLIGR